MLEAFQQLVVLLIIMGAGVVLARIGILNETFLGGLNQFLIQVTLPCMLFNAMLREYSAELMHNSLVLIGIALIFYGMIIVLVELWGRHSKIGRQRAGLYQFMMVNGNTGFLGFPVIQAVAGDLALFYSNMFCIVQTVLMYTYGLYAVSRGSDRSITWRRMLTSKPLIATVLGLIVFVSRFPLPYVVIRPIAWIGDMTIPISLLIVGAWLSRCKFRELFHPVGIWVTTALRLVALPAVTTLSLYLCGARGLILMVPAVMLGTPVALLAENFAMEYQNDVMTAGKTIMLSNLLSVVSLPILVTILMAIA